MCGCVFSYLNPPPPRQKQNKNNEEGVVVFSECPFQSQPTKLGLTPPPKKTERSARDGWFVRWTCKLHDLTSAAVHVTTCPPIGPLVHRCACSKWDLIHGCVPKKGAGPFYIHQPQKGSLAKKRTCPCVFRKNQRGPSRILLIPLRRRCLGGIGNLLRAGPTPQWVCLKIGSNKNG